MARCSWVPRLLNWNTLHYDSNAGEKRNESSDRKAAPDNPDLDLIPHNPKKKYADSCLAHTDDHDSSYLAEELILDGCEVYDWITDLRE